MLCKTNYWTEVRYRRITMKEKKKTRRQDAAAKLLAVYANLAHSERDLLQEMLLQHAFLYVGNRFYIDWAEWNECDRRTSYLGLLEQVSADAADAWYEWAKEIAMENLSAETVREVILSFICDLVSFRFLEQPLPGEVFTSERSR
jgi:hypothetical protein